MKRFIGAVAAVVAIAVLAIFFWLTQRNEFEWHIAAPLPLPNVPVDNPMSDAKVELGRRLFYDPRLSINETMSCASCHIQSLAFTDGKARSIGATSEQHPRGAMSLVNSAYASRLTWANNLLDRLEDQALTPLLGDNPVEMGMAGRESEIASMLSNDVYYASLMREAFPADANPYSVLNVVRGTSAFVRTIISFNSPYDAFLRGDVDAIDMSAKRGMDLFFSERLECFHCHGGFNFTDSSTHANANIDSVGFHNTGLYNVDDNGAYPPVNTGLFDMTGQRRDMGRFKAPTLRNIAVTAPYMHDGSVLSLGDAIAHYERGGRELTEGPHTGDGRLSPYKSEFIRGFSLSSEERADLLAFLRALTDQHVLTDARWSDPWQ